MSSVVSMPEAVQKAVPVEPHAKACAVCHEAFVWFFPAARRRSHCDLCGKAVCNGCLHNEPLSFQEFRMCNTCRATSLPRLRGLLRYPWFHGRISRDEAERRLRTDSSALGDFLVRVAPDTEERPHHFHGGRHSSHDHAAMEGADMPLFILSVRNTPASVAHFPIRGQEGEYFLDRTANFSTIPELVASSMESDMLDRSAVVSADTHFPVCPTCTAALPTALTGSSDNHGDNGDGSSHQQGGGGLPEFCECGARLASTAEARKIFDNIGFEYLHHATTA
ncbi:hypothetical protein PTSG_09603 [Salpingoeca rosetta]|uniref:FYVE-type domain-containing protein n=1 Tax=Salpingoeca rosetta (strain ATCC 50818 / BSB-021) TaxID=946362 RepID=F2ULH1_SALR5|nr:uncharacterized protein PTSG_09603 [Salpingoeca rosetta]EGD77970.1 hypothetical protein PTSG_09603 [Salpingoeca rosetta]|eukprot:XP_004990032.1 hypothetical protein PTSG_09603 [Salpingoeca rosetta]